MYRDDPRLDFDPDCISALSEKRQSQWDRIQNASFLTRNEKREAAGYAPVAGDDEDDGGDSDEPSPAAKYNHNHDPDNGQFTSGSGDGGEDNSSEPIQMVQRFPPPVEDMIEELPSSSGPKPSPNFKPPTNPPQLPPTDIPEGWRIREMPPTEQYPDGYWRLEKPMDNGGWQGIDPSTMKPGTDPETHIPLPPHTIMG